MHCPSYALFIQWKHVFHCLTARLPFDNTMFCICHNTPDSRPDVRSQRKGALSEVPRWFQIWSWARCQDWEVSSLLPAYPAPLTGLMLFPRGHWVQQELSPRICTHCLHDPCGEPGIPSLTLPFLVLCVSLSSTPGRLVQTHSSASRQT